MSTPWASLLYPSADDAQSPVPAEPTFFHDLNLDQLADSLAGDKDPYGLRALLYAPAATQTIVAWRHAVFQDLEHAPVRGAVDNFLQDRAHFLDLESRRTQADHPHEKSRWRLDALALYCAAVRRFAAALQEAQPASDGFRALADHLRSYVASDALQALERDTQGLLRELDAIRYNVLMDDLRVEVSRAADEPDYGAEIARTFARFEGGTPARREQHMPSMGQCHLAAEPWLNTIDERILTQLTKLYPDLFARVQAHVRQTADVVDPVVQRVARELRFFLGWLHYIAPLQAAGQAFCYPQFAPDDGAIVATGTCDLVLAHQLAASKTPVVTNDFRLRPPERILLVSGPNQGGKTTFARAFGQLHYLARLGVPLPAAHATLRWWSTLATHFERAEDIHSLRGKLEDDLVRMHAILEHVDGASVVIMNEIFSSTTTDDARFLATRVLRQLLARSATAVCVSFLDDLVQVDAKAIVSMASTVNPDDPAIRTFRVLRKAPDGKAYAEALAAKHHLTPADLEARLGGVP